MKRRCCTSARREEWGRTLRKHCFRKWTSPWIRWKERIFARPGRRTPERCWRLTAAALRCLNGQILARLVVSKPEHAERLAKMGVKDLKRVYDTEDLAPGKKMIFACTGVTDGNLLKGVRFFGEGVRTSSMILTLDERQVRFIDSVHLEKRPDIKVRFN